jgi:CheY-like chemotaxis protein
VARIGIIEPQQEVRDLFAHVVARLGHELVEGVPEDVDLLLVEPADPAALAAAASLRSRRPDLPIVCASILPQMPEARALAPAAYLLKPFALAELGAALTAALAAAAP